MQEQPVNKLITDAELITLLQIRLATALTAIDRNDRMIDSLIKRQIMLEEELHSATGDLFKSGYLVSDKWREA